MKIEFLFKHPSGEMRVWSPAPADIDEWRSEFPGLNVIEQLNSLAAWTVQNQNVKSKQRQMKTALRWVRSMLKKEWQKSEAASRVTQARQQLSKPQWEREGLTEEQWRKKQEELFYNKRQDELTLEGRTAEPDKIALLRAVSDDLRAIEATLVPIQWGNRKVPWEGCSHTWIQHHYLDTLWCPKCNMTQHQLLA